MRRRQAVESQEVPPELRTRAEAFAEQAATAGDAGVSGLIAEGQALADVVAGTVVPWDRLFRDD